MAPQVVRYLNIGMGVALGSLRALECYVGWHTVRIAAIVLCRVNRGSHLVGGLKQQLFIISPYFCNKIKLNKYLSSTYFTVRIRMHYISIACIFFHWHYSSLWALACRIMSFHFFLSATNSVHLLTSST